MKRALLLLYVILLPSIVHAQQLLSATNITIDGIIQDTSANESHTYIPFDHEPTFPGGMEAFYKFMATNIRYPIAAKEQHTEGKVVVSFAIEEDGVLTDIKVLKSVSADIDAEAVKIIGYSPKWKPATQNGKPVRIRYYLPITFSSQQSTPPPVPAKHADPDADMIPEPPRDTTSTNGIYKAVEHEPEFPGGIEKLYRYLGRNLRYPAAAKENNIQGKVFVTFVVEIDGSLTDIKVSKSLSPETDAEAIRLMKASPKWNPGIQNGRAVRTQYTLPVAFTLADYN